METLFTLESWISIDNSNYEMKEMNIENIDIQKDEIKEYALAIIE